MASLPKTHCAIVQTADLGLTISPSQPLPYLAHTSVLVKNHTVALNPTDYKLPTYFPHPGTVAGCDFAGTIVALGSNVTHLALGTRVCGAVFGSNPLDPQTGAFAEYIAVRAQLLIKVPSKMSWEDAAALGAIGHGTCNLALWESRHLGLQGTPERPLVEEKKTPVLVYGGSTATGTMALQLLKLSGYDPICTCSPHSVALVTSYGASKSFAYALSNCAADIRAYTNNRLRYALDCISDHRSVEICYAAIGRMGGSYVSLEHVSASLKTRNAVKASEVMGYEMFGSEVALDEVYGREANPEAGARHEAWLKVVEDLLSKGVLKSHPAKAVDGSFQGVLKGLENLKKGEVVGEKLVVSLK